MLRGCGICSRGGQKLRGAPRPPLNTRLLTTFSRLHMFANSINTSKNMYNSREGHIFKSNILCNDLLLGRDGGILTSIFSEQNWNQIAGNAADLTFESFFMYNNDIITGIVNKRSLERRFSITISEDEYKELYSNVAAWYKKYKDRQALAKCCFFKYLNRKTTSSKSLRSFWSQQDGYLSKASYTNYFCKKTGIPRNEILKPYKAYIGIWAISFLTYDLAQFIFKFSHNKIFTNDRISKFNQDVDRTCFFCLKEGLSPPPSVSVTHTFFYCKWLLNT